MHRERYRWLGALLILCFVVALSGSLLWWGSRHVMALEASPPAVAPSSIADSVPRTRPRCAACHNDPHLWTEGRDCHTCHNASSFQDVRFDHNNAVDCQSCHEENAPTGHYPVQCSTCHANTAKLVGLLGAVPGIEPLFDRPSFHERVLRLPLPVAEVLRSLAAHNVLGGHDLGRDYPGLGEALLVAPPRSAAATRSGPMPTRWLG